MNLKDLYINFFISKNHKWIPSAPVVPENDSSVLFNTAGMQPLIPYLLGQEHPYGKRLVDYQMCIRTNDLDEIGDETHHTFFEMLGNWSLGDYFKEESIKYSYEFLTEVLKFDKNKLAISIFKGNDLIPKDTVSEQAWLNLGIKKERIALLGVEDNFWIAGETGPCGPDTEIFYWRSESEIPDNFNPDDKRWVEIWNNVFMEYNKDELGNYQELPNKNVDTGMGVERVTSIIEGVNDNYLSSIWKDIINKLSSISNKTYDDNSTSMRIIADHLRASVFILADKSLIRPSNTDRGYILRRLIRRAIRHAKNLNIDINSNWDESITKIIINQYQKYYPELKEKENYIYEELKKEKNKFNNTLEKGLKEFDKITKNLKDNHLNKDLAFKLYDTYGFPIELTAELASELNIKVDVEGFKEKFKIHQELSRNSASSKFKGGLANNSDIQTKYHTTTHLLNAALKIVLGEDTHQMGSNITDERLRFDFNSDHKLSNDEINDIDTLVNGWIKDSILVTRETMSKEEAIKSGAECMFIDKYPDQVMVYTINGVSKELCGGPHVSNTSELGTFKIIKEEASSAGVRRIKAILEK